VTALLTARADVPTATPERYAKQLAVGDCLLRSHEGSLELLASAAGADDLERVQSVVGSHLERFGQRNELQVV
jgi:hypothetical protein